MCSDLDSLTDDEFVTYMIEQREREKKRGTYYSRRNKYQRKEERRELLDAGALRGTPHGVVPALFFKPDWWDDAI